MRMLTYAGDMTSAVHFEEEGVQPGQLFGWDPTGRPYEILDIEVYREGDPAYLGDADQGEMFCAMCERDTTHTHIHLVYARPQTLKDQLQMYAIFNQARGLI